MAIHFFSLETLPAVAWKNGGGLTREVVCVPAAAGFDDFDWRVSIAEIAASGPFSRFDGIDRTIVLLAGDGVRLSGEGWQHALDTPFAPFSFRGEEVCSAQLLGARSQDFNVMTRRARWRHTVDLCRARVAPRGGDGVLLFLAGVWRDTAGACWQPGQGMCWQAHAEALPAFAAEDGTGVALLASIAGARA